MPTPRVIDLSHHNTIPESLKPARQAGIIGVIHKLTEGTTFVDKKVQARRALADDAGMLFGLYHFMRVGQIEAQAQFFVQTALDLHVMDDQTCLVADHEDPAVSGKDLLHWLETVEKLTNRDVVTYSGHVLKEQMQGKGYKTDRRFWLAQYTTGKPTLPEGISKYWLWQYTDKGSVAGVQSPVDLNHFDGDEATFRASWSGNASIPTPGPEPGPMPKPTITISSDIPVRLKLGPNIELV